MSMCGREGPGEGDRERASLRAEMEESRGSVSTTKFGREGKAKVGREGNVDTVGIEG